MYLQENMNKVLILETERDDKLVQKTLEDLSGIIDGTFTFGTGIGAFLPSVRQLLSGSNIEISETQLVLVYITAIFMIMGKNKELVKKLLNEINEQGLFDVLKKVADYLNSVEKVVFKVFENVGYSLNSMTDILSFTFIAFPILDILEGLIKHNMISIDNPTSYLNSILIGIGAIGFKNIFNDLIKKIKSRKSLNETKISYDVGTLKIVEDIIDTIEENIEKQGTFVFFLPEDLPNTDYLYSVEGSEFNLELNLILDNEVEEPFVDAGFYPEEESLEIIIKLNPNDFEIDKKTLFIKLVEYIRHEFQHHGQLLRDELPLTDDDITDPYEYYSQEHELDALAQGLRLRAEYENRPIEDVILDSLKDNQKTYGLKDEDLTDLSQKILDRLKL